MKNDFGNGRIWKVVLAQSIPLLFAQLVHLLYNVVDRIYIGHLPGTGAIALTGIGLAFPITTLVAAFTNLFATGGTPLYAIALGQKNEDRAERVLGQAAVMLGITSIILFLVGMFFRRDILYLFGASDVSYVYADAYLKVYLWGTAAAMLSTGLNGFINASGYPRTGMMTVFIGAFLNLVLDPVFIYGMHMGVTGAALATIISQMVSCIWALYFFLKKEAPYRIRAKYLKPSASLLAEIVPLGTAGFVMQGTNTLVSILCNVTLRTFGGDLYVGIMTIINSVREIVSLPSMCITHGSQPVMSFNYGAQKYSRIKECIRFITVGGLVYAVAAWIVVLLIPGRLMSIFTNDQEMIALGVHSLKLYFFAFAFMAFQMAGQTTFTALRCTKRAIFFSLFRKVVIVVPLTVLLPRLGFGVDGVYMAEPVSNVIGGLACGLGMYLSVYRKLPADGEPAHI
ncbi:MAG: MATE family efflux transporter [Solobacterium sp.]|nr:MATE family efflux transporter [Solobacterium sp.]